MNQKLIAIAVISAVVSSASSFADVTVYGRINNAIAVVSPEGGIDDNTTDIQNVSSRFGIKASNELDNGLTATGRYEFATQTDRRQDNIAGLRIGTVGISGDFGSVTVGNQWSAFYDTVGTHIDPTYTLGQSLYSSIVGGPYRGSNTIKYSNSFGPIYLEVDGRLNGSAESRDIADTISGNGLGAGISISATDNLTLALAVDSERNTTAGGVANPNIDTNRVGVAAKLSTDSGFFTMLGYQDTEEEGGVGFEADQTQLWVGTTIGNSTTLMLGLGETFSSVGNHTDISADAVVLGAYYNLGGGLKLWYEGISLDGNGAPTADAGTADRNEDIHLLGMRIDF